MMQLLCFGFVAKALMFKMLFYFKATFVALCIAYFEGTGRSISNFSKNAKKSYIVLYKYI